jgi:tape measure domain-containing protein
MAFEVGSAIARIKADLGNFKQGVRDAKGETEELGGTVSKVGTVIKGALIAGSVAAAAGVVLLGKSALEAAGDFEQTRISFETMLGSASKANKLLADLQEFAKRTPFSLVELQEGTKRLLAYGVEGENVIDTMRTLGNITSAVGRDKMPQLILAFGQVKAVGHLTGMELRQFAETGVPLLQILADQFKVSTAEVQDMVSAGKVGFADVQKALESLGGEGGKWGDMMDRQSKTLQGSLSNLSDSWNQLLIVLGTLFIPLATQVVSALNNILMPIMAVMQGSKSLGEAFGLTAEQTAFLEGALAEFQSFMSETLAPAVATILAFMKAQWTEHKDLFITVWNIILGSLQVIWSIIYGIIKVGLELIAGDWQGAWDAILQMTQGVWDGLQRIFGAALSYIANWGSSVLKALVQPFEDAWGRIQDIVRKIKDALDFTKRHSPSVVDIVQRGVHLVNRAFDDLEVNPGSIRANVAPVGIGNNGGNVTHISLTIPMNGAIISDQLGAQRMAEAVGNNIVKTLQKQIRF